VIAQIVDSLIREPVKLAGLSARPATAFSMSSMLIVPDMRLLSMPLHCAGRARRDPEQPLPQLQKSAADAL
jgi:hypothetical protein